MSTPTVLVTGAGRGIGRAIAVRLAHSGWQVYGGVRTDAAATQLSAESDLITPVELDVTVPQHLATLDRELPPNDWTAWSTTSASRSRGLWRR